MELCTEGAYAELLQYTQRIENIKGRFQALYFPFSLLTPQFRSDYQLKIALNITNDMLVKEKGSIFFLDNSDIIVLFDGKERALLEKTIFQQRYLFMDDPLAYNDEGYENSAFCLHFHLADDWDSFLDIITAYGDRSHDNADDSPQDITDEAFLNAMESHQNHRSNRSQKKIFLTPAHLAEVTDFIDQCDIEPCFRFQPTCLFDKDSNVFRPLFKEIYINIAHLEKLLPTPVDLLSHPVLFHYITECLDRRLLRALTESGHDIHAGKSFSINMNCRSLTGDAFAALDAKLNPDMKKRVIIEAHVSDVFSDASSYNASYDLLRKKGYRMCLDGVSAQLLPRLRASAFGCDLIKIQWPGNNDDLSDDALRDAITENGASRIVLCRCDNEDAVAFGLAHGVLLFQGRYIDAILDPDAPYVN